MASSSLLRLLLHPSVRVNSVRHGHQTSTKNSCHRPKPKHRGIKRQENEVVHQGDILVTQRILRIHPGMNVGLMWTKSLYALCLGKVKFTSEKFDPNFDHPVVMAQYEGRQGQSIYKKYVNVIPPKEHRRFKLIDVV